MRRLPPRPRHPQTRKEQFTLRGIAQEARVRDHDGSDCTEVSDDFSCVIEPTNMGVSGSKNAVRSWVTRAFLDAEEQIPYGSVETSAEKMWDTALPGGDRGRVQGRCRLGAAYQNVWRDPSSSGQYSPA